MTKKEVVELFIKEGVLILENGKYVLAANYYPKTSKIDKNFENLLKEYADLWPKGVKSGNRLIRRSANSLRKNMLAFVKLRPDATSVEIITATEVYLRAAKRQNWEYTQCADYFIFKNKSSELESHVDLVKDGDVVSPDSENLLRSLN